MTQEHTDRSNETICIISYELGDNRSVEITTEFARLFWCCGINTSIVAITKWNQQQVSLFSTQGLLLLGQNVDALEAHVLALADFASTRPLTVVHLTERCLACPPQINANKVIKFDAEFQVMVSNIFNAIRGHC